MAVDFGLSVTWVLAVFFFIVAFATVPAYFYVQIKRKSRFTDENVTILLTILGCIASAAFSRSLYFVQVSLGGIGVWNTSSGWMLAITWSLPDIFLFVVTLLVVRLSAQANCFEKEMFLFTEEKFRSQLNIIETSITVAIWLGQISLFAPLGFIRLLYWITYEQIFIGSISFFVVIYTLAVWCVVRCFKSPRSVFPKSSLAKKMFVISAACVWGRVFRFLDCFGVSTIWTHTHEYLATNGLHWVYTLTLFTLTEAIPLVIILLALTRLNFLDDHQRSVTIHQLRERLRKMGPQKYVEPENLIVNKELLGSGAMAAVYSGQLYNTPVAIKVFSESFMHDPSVVSSAIKEISLLCKLRHPLVTDLLAFTVKDGSICMVFPRYPCRLSDKKITKPEQIVKVALDACDVLRYLEEINVVHGDIKPDNFLISREGNHVVLIDFGSAILLKPNSHLPLTLSHHEKSSKTVLRKPKKTGSSSSDHEEDLSLIVEVTTDPLEYTPIASYSPGSSFISCKSSDDDEDVPHYSPSRSPFGSVSQYQDFRSTTGTQGYMAPENGVFSPKTDIYSLGKVIEELCRDLTHQHDVPRPELSVPSFPTHSSSSSSSSFSSSPVSSSSSYFQGRRHSGSQADPDHEPSGTNLLASLLRIAGECTAHNPSHRPTAFQLSATLSNLLKHPPSVLF